jgi:ribosomal protein S18 acetylase RimI-like enzyme
VDIRPVRADEWERWREVRVRMLREESAYFSSRWEDVARQPESYWRDWVEAAAAGATRCLYVVEEDGRWVGAVGCHLRVDPSETQLISMWVAPAARGRGIAQELIRAVAAWARDHGCEGVYLFVQEANAPARRLYEQAGFRPTGEREQLPTRRGFKILMSARVDALVGEGTTLT